MIHTLIYLLVVCIVVGLIWWAADFFVVPEPLNRLLKGIAIIFGIIVICYALLNLGGIAIPA